MKQPLLNASIAIFALALILSWVFHGTGVVKNDIKRNIYIPETLTIPLQVKAAYNGDKMFFRYRWPAKEPHIYHDMMKFQDGKWNATVEFLFAAAGYHEVRPCWYDGAVPEFEKYGGYITIGDRMLLHQRGQRKKSRHIPTRQKKQVEVGKHLPETRSHCRLEVEVPEAQLQAQRGRHFIFGTARTTLQPDRQVRRPGIAEARYGDEVGRVLRQLGQGQEQPKHMLIPPRSARPRSIGTTSPTTSSASMTLLGARIGQAYDPKVA